MLAVRCRLDQISTIFSALLPARRNAELRESRPLVIHYRPLADMLVTTCGSLIPLGTPSVRTRLELLQIRVDNAVQVREYKTQNIKAIISLCVDHGIVLHSLTTLTLPNKQKLYFTHVQKMLNLK
jgi:hypothetical protein